MKYSGPQARAALARPEKAGPGDGTAEIRLTEASRNGEGPRLLLVDDEADFRHAVAGVLREAGCRVWESASYGAALDLLRRRSFEVVVTEMRLPGGDGFDLLREARRRQPHLRLIGHTVAQPADLNDRMKECGLERFFLKPLRIDRLLRVIRGGAPRPSPDAGPAPSRADEAPGAALSATPPGGATGIL